jgi:hypothetical protein
MREAANKKALARFIEVGPAAKVTSLENRTQAGSRALGENRSIARATSGGKSG